MPSYSCWIDGRREEGSSGYTLINPSTGEKYAQATIAGESLVDLALNSARESMRQWRSMTARKRTALLHLLAECIRREREALAHLVSREVGKTLRAAGDEVSSAASIIDYFAEENLRMAGRIPLLGHSREQVLIVREPVGVVAAITPFNYPLSTLATKLAPALAVGCAVVAKPDEHTPASTLRLAELASESGLPPGVFNVVTGPGPETGGRLVDHPIPRLVTFTGSTEVGKGIQAVSSRWARKVILELGGHCPAIVCADAPWRELLPQLVLQSFKNSGQYCYRISRMYVAAAIYDDFLNGLIQQTGRLRVGPADDAGVDLGPLNNPEVLVRVRSQVEAAVREGAQLKLGGNEEMPPGPGFFYPPTILTSLSPRMSIMKEEVFGPVVMVSPFDDMDQAIHEANATPFGLAAYLFTRQVGDALDWAGKLEAGSVWINRIHQAYPEAPFGGVKESGLGREKSSFGLEEFTELKTIYLSY